MINDEKMLQFIMKNAAMGCLGINEVKPYASDAEIRNALRSQNLEYGHIYHNAYNILKNRGYSPAKLNRFINFGREKFRRHGHIREPDRKFRRRIAAALCDIGLRRRLTGDAALQRGAARIECHDRRFGSVGRKGERFLAPAVIGQIAGIAAAKTERRSFMRPDTIAGFACPVAGIELSVAAHERESADRQSCFPTRSSTSRPSGTRKWA